MKKPAPVTTRRPLPRRHLDVHLHLPRALACRIAQLDAIERLLRHLMAGQGHLSRQSHMHTALLKRLLRQGLDGAQLAELHTEIDALEAAAGQLTDAMDAPLTPTQET